MPRDPAPTEPSVEPEPSRALVATASWAASGRGEQRPLAGFVAQLIASERRLPDYRKSVRIAPDRAADAYGGDVGTVGRPSLDRSV